MSVWLVNEIIIEVIGASIDAVVVDAKTRSPLDALDCTDASPLRALAFFFFLPSPFGG